MLRRFAIVPVALVLACWSGDHTAQAGAGAATTPVVLVDADGREVRLAQPARRIISLLPSATELLVAFGATDRIVGRTAFDTDSAVRNVPVVGGMADANLETILSLAPDVVVAWEGGKDERLRRRLDASGIPSVSLRAQDTTDFFRCITILGRLTGLDSSAAALSARLRADLADVHRSVEHLPRPSVFYVVWNNPPMTAGPRTFIGQILSLAGGATIFPDLEQNWPTIGMEEVVRLQPDVIVLPSGEMEAISVEELGRLPGWRDLTAVRKRRIVRLPADLMNRPGPRVAEAARALRDALHPALSRPAS